MKKNVMLIGLGPHAKRIYINLFKKHDIKIKLIIDVKKNSLLISKYLKENNIETEVYFVNDQDVNLLELNEITKKEILDIVYRNNIKYAIISTEPKAHFAYAKFLVSNNINILLDKPITAPINVMNNYTQAKKVEKEYLYLCDLYKKHQQYINFQIQCQRRFHVGYIYIKNVLKEIIEKYGIPITYIDIYHCDGMWNMPSEFFSRENHPYKYGYGKLFHSGYHFIDLLAWFLECNDSLKNKINNVDVYSTTFKPYDFFNVINNDFYEKHMNTDKFKDVLSNPSKLKKFGELDLHAMFDFRYDDKIITHCSLNLMQSGFSKRSWTELPIDTYKSNGRVRHERINIQVGPLLNIQMHSYQSLEVNETKKSNYSVGDIDHFDIYIFRNDKIIGGKSFEKFSIKDLLKNNNNNFLGNNEKAREICFLKFLNDEKDGSNLLDHQKGILLLTKLCEMQSLEKNKISFEWRNYYE